MVRNANGEKIMLFPHKLGQLPMQVYTRDATDTEQTMGFIPNIQFANLEVVDSVQADTQLANINNSDKQKSDVQSASIQGNDEVPVTMTQMNLF